MTENNICRRVPTHPRIRRMSFCRSCSEGNVSGCICGILSFGNNKKMLALAGHGAPTHTLTIFCSKPFAPIVGDIVTHSDGKYKICKISSVGEGVLSAILLSEKDEPT